MQYYLTKGAAGSCLSIITLGDMAGSRQLDNSVIMVFNQLIRTLIIVNLLLLPFIFSMVVSQDIYWQDNLDLVKELDKDRLVVLMGGTMDIVCKVEHVSLYGEFKWLIAGDVAVNHEETILSKKNGEIRSELKLTNVTLDMNEKTVKCQYSELFGDYGTNIWSVAAQLVVFPISEEYRNKQGEAVEKRRKEKIEEFNNIHIMNTVSKERISVNETEFEKKLQTT